MPNIDYAYQGTTYTNVYTYMGWQLITDTTSKQYELRSQAGMNFDSEGFGKIGNRYVIACTDPSDNGGMFGTIGDYIDWVMPGGATLYTIVGDTKSSGDSNWIPLGHTYGDSVSVIEFVVDRDTWYTSPMHANPGTSDCHPEWKGQVRSWLNRGNYFTNKNGATVTPDPEKPDETEDVGGTGSSGEGTQFDTNVSYIELLGNDILELHTSGNPILFYKTNTGIWIPRNGGNNSSTQPTETPDNPGPDPTPDPTPGTSGEWDSAGALAWCQANKYCYSYNQGFYSYTDGVWCYRGMDAVTSGECDCSGFVWKMIHAFARDTFDALQSAGFVDSQEAGGTDSFWRIAQNSNYGSLIFDSAQTSTPYNPPDLVAGDIFLCAGGWYKGEEFPKEYTEKTPRHVLMYMADGTFWDVTSGCGYTMANDNWGPTQTPDDVFTNKGHLRRASRWVVIRLKWR